MFAPDMAASRGSMLDHASHHQQASAGSGHGQPSLAGALPQRMPSAQMPRPEGSSAGGGNRAVVQYAPHNQMPMCIRAGRSTCLHVRQGTHIYC